MLLSHPNRVNDNVHCHLHPSTLLYVMTTALHFTRFTINIIQMVLFCNRSNLEKQKLIWEGNCNDIIIQ